MSDLWLVYLAMRANIWTTCHQFKEFINILKIYYSPPKIYGSKTDKSHIT
jgi:hypothetical protein